MKGNDCRGSASSHEIPVQPFLLHLTHQVHQATFEKDLEAQVVFNHQGGTEASLHNLGAYTFINMLPICSDSRMLKYLPAEVHLFPNVVVGKEASELSFSQWATMIGVTVAREHVDAHSMNLTDVHRSAIKEHIGDIVRNNSCVKRGHWELTFHLQLRWPCMKSSAHIMPSAYVFAGQFVSAGLSWTPVDGKQYSQCNSALITTRGCVQRREWIEGHFCRIHLHVTQYSPHQSPFCQVVF